MPVMYDEGRMKALLASLYRTIASQQSTAIAWFVIIVLTGMIVTWFVVQR
jgi:hypothetical protein